MTTGTPLMEQAAVPQTTAQKPAASGLPAWLPRCGAAVLAGGLLWACYFPLAWGWALGWITLVPLLLLVRAPLGWRGLFGLGLLSGAIFYFPVLQWMRVADVRMTSTWLLLATYCALYVPLGLLLVRWLERRWRLPLAVAVPLVWVALEYFRAWFITGFSWYLLAHTQHQVLELIQVADLGGVFLLSFLVAAVNGLLADALYQIPAVRGLLHLDEPEQRSAFSTAEARERGVSTGLPFRTGLLIEAGVIVVLLLSSYLYGVYRLGQRDFEPGPTVALLQGNIDVRIRNEAAAPGAHADTSVDIFRHYARLCRAGLEQPWPDLLVWPETSYPARWFEVSPELPAARVPEEWRRNDAETRQHFRGLAQMFPTKHLLGINTTILDGDGVPRQYNSAILLTPQGNVDGRFDKMHRIPFGEFVPFRDWLPFMDVLSPYDYDFGIRSGEKFTRFPLGKHTFGVLICYEDSDPFLARRYAVDDEDGAPVDFLLNISNDGWFDGTSEHEEHLAVSRFRAVECRRALARSVNMGISAVIDGNGRLLKPTLVRPATKPKALPGLPPEEPRPAVWAILDEGGRPPEASSSEWGRLKKIDGVLKAVIPIDRRSSLYAQLGDWLPRACWLGLAALVGVALFRRSRPAMA